LIQWNLLFLLCLWNQSNLLFLLFLLCLWNQSIRWSLSSPSIQYYL
jgi:hypothetical protein